MTNMMLGDPTLESLTPSVNAPLGNFSKSFETLVPTIEEHLLCISYQFLILKICIHMDVLWFLLV